MALIQTIEPEKAEGQAKEIYYFMMENAGVSCSAAACKCQSMAVG